MDGLPVYLVLERNAVISADLADTLRAIAPCKVIRESEPRRVPQALSGVTSLEAALLDVSYERAVETGLEKLLAPLGGRKILTAGHGTGKSSRYEGWIVLERPFTDRMLLDVLRHRI